MAFRNRFAALAMATDVTERRQVEHRNKIFSKLSHRLSSATTASEAAMIICEAADGLFKWDDFALDLYFAERDEVFSLLNITTVEGQRVEIAPALQPKTANALIRRVVERGAELSLRQRGEKLFRLHDAGAHPQRLTGHRRVVHPKPFARRLLAKRPGHAPNPGRTVQRRAGSCPRPRAIDARASSASATCLKIRPTRFS